MIIKLKNKTKEKIIKDLLIRLSISFVVITFPSTLFSTNTADINQSIPEKVNDKLIRESDTIATKLSLPFLFKVRKDLDKSEFQWNLWLKSIDDQPSNILFNSFARMPEGIFNPTYTEIVQHEINMVKGLSIPTVFNFSPYAFSINLSDAATFLGLMEDVSPVISYTLHNISDVEIVIYSISAKVIATIFTGTQRPGSYTITWNGKDDLGKKMPSGDYVGEVKIGSRRLVMKRIVIK